MNVYIRYLVLHLQFQMINFSVRDGQGGYWGADDSFITFGLFMALFIVENKTIWNVTIVPVLRSNEEAQEQNPPGPELFKNNSGEWETQRRKDKQLLIKQTCQTINLRVNVRLQIEKGNM